jgi:hypothetical protein
LELAPRLTEKRPLVCIIIAAVSCLPRHVFGNGVSLGDLWETAAKQIMSAISSSLLGPVT